MGASTSSLALNRLRAMVVVIVVAFHSDLAYLGSLSPSAFAFDEPPYKWRAFAIVDSHRWFGFDVFCAWQDTYLMALMFFVSALFAWPSLERKGSWTYLIDRIARLGVPFAFGVLVVAPLALYPVYRLSALDPSPAAYLRDYLALPFLPNGPMWFLWELLALSALGAALHALAPQWGIRLARLSSSARAHPGRYSFGLAALAALAYVPLALAFTPWGWAEKGPLAFQLSRPLLYGVFYFAGLGVGAFGLDRGLLGADGMLARRWTRWLAGALLAFVSWMGLTALAMRYGSSAPLVIELAADVGYAAACVGGCFFALAACLRFGAARSRVLDSLAENAFGIYVLHYPFVVWLQYALLDAPMPALAKAALVTGGTLLLSWSMASLLRSSALASRLIGGASLVAKAPSESGANAPATNGRALQGAASAIRISARR